MNKTQKIFISLIVFAIFGFYLSGSVKADTVSELRDKISNSNSEIEKLEKEIQAYRQELQKTQAEGLTLQNELNRIETTRKKHVADINLTENKIENALYNIERLSIEIKASEEKIVQKKETISEIMREIREADDENIIEILLSENTISDFLQKIDVLEKLQGEVRIDMLELEKLKLEMEKKIAEEQLKTEELQVLRFDLIDQRTIAEQNASEQKELISITKNKESEFQQLIAEKQARKKAFEEEIRKAEEAIKIIIDPNKLPEAGSGVLIWPFDKVVVTQYFGNTKFATQNSQIYNGNGHNGIDLGAPVGTSIKSASSGVVLGFGDTDQTCQGASYGKWVLIRHNNGLSTLYAHLSLIRVSEGQTVEKGQVIGFSGNTGYSTGPHLHFTVFASEGVKIGKLQSRNPNCGVYTLPLASQNSYLNPLSYLPSPN